MRNKYFLYGFVLMLFIYSCGVNRSLKQSVDVSNFPQNSYEVVQQSDSIRTIGTNFLRQNKTGNWEVFVSGNPYEIGQKKGLLTKDLFHQQEHIFFAAVQNILGENKKTGFLNSFMRWFNRDIHDYIIPEYKAELFGLAESATDEFTTIAPAYQRTLYLHGAHDIGHAMTDLMVVGCSSFALWDEFSADGELIVGRNFDFYLDDAFAENKLIQIVQPEKGFAFLSIGWPGFLGVTSGMNAEGLTVTINAGKSTIPLKAKTPISLVVREILQYAKTIDEAIEIAKTKEVFVSESIMVSSAADRKAVLIEISPKKFDVKYPTQDYLISTNHFQSAQYQNDKRNIKQMNESHSMYRYAKLEEQIAELKPFDDQKVAKVLRDYTGLNEKNIGFGNEKALNQLLAHHAVIFRPEKKLVYVSSAPYNLGEFTVYDMSRLDENFSVNTDLIVEELKIPQDDFVNTQAFNDYEGYKVLRRFIHQKLEQKEIIPEVTIQHYIQLNPEFWEVYYDAGLNYIRQKKYDSAQEMFQMAKSKEVTTLPDVEKIDKQLKKLKNKVK